MSQSQPNVSMYYRFGEDNLPLGKCNPATARVLVKKELATWEDGNLKVILRPAHSEILDRDPYQLIRRAEDDQNVSKAELDRRLDWFKQFIRKATMALASMGMPREIDPEEINAAKVIADNLKFMAENEAAQYLEEDEGQFQLSCKRASDEDLKEYGFIDDGIIISEEGYCFPPNTNVVAAESSKSTNGMSAQDTIEMMSKFWESAPDVSNVFGVPASNPASYVKTPIANIQTLYLPKDGEYLTEEKIAFNKQILGQLLPGIPEPESDEELRALAQIIITLQTKGILQTEDMKYYWAIIHKDTSTEDKAVLKDVLGLSGLWETATDESCTTNPKLKAQELDQTILYSIQASGLGSSFEAEKTPEKEALALLIKNKVYARALADLKGAKIVREGFYHSGCRKIPSELQNEKSEMNNLELENETALLG